MRKIKSVLIAAVFCLPVSSQGADTTEDLRVKRTRRSFSAGVGVQRAKLNFKSDTVKSNIELTAIPQLLLAGDFWVDEALGLIARMNIGTGAKVDGLFGQSVNVNTLGYTLGARYRWHLSPRARTTSVGVHFGLHGYKQSAQDQRPSVILNRHIIGPGLGAFVTQPWGSGHDWVRISLRYELPFFLREEPTDSGDPQSFSAFGGRTELNMKIHRDWALGLEFDYLMRRIDFDGAATRAGGTNNGLSNEAMMMLGLYARWLQH